MSEDFNDMWYWFPKLVTTGVLVPRTKMVRTEVDLLYLLDGKTPDGFDDLIGRLRAAGETTGWPIFLRTGHTSGKHDWKRTCFVESSDQLPQHVAGLVEYGECCSAIGLPTNTWVVREFLKLESSFTTNNGMPVNRERRFFIEDGKVLCHHPYWPANAVKRLILRPRPASTSADLLNDDVAWKCEPVDWESRLSELNTIDGRELNHLEQQCELVSRSFDGAWSVDWAKTADGRWLCIDMATADRSFHWEGCEIAKQRGWPK